ncbi:UDP-N-acetylmuramate dehydrogenase [Kineococcus xinjiangensis]|uniref:UDP-N-acetylenolpyruvoylglucosamine reductase n=1 Tax=Kineococcus xinjiangensis TaxID=512762 RepID=A0A2S6ITF2_9ACTN|nr:UDP-N-acetylmuramate dehydrogenase [Kineococcus xinjiangensis]PPK97519.1 UDP-N-acetylmuramate dehydrogenase [Kineococcus xinjiangensis]
MSSAANAPASPPAESVPDAPLAPLTTLRVGGPARRLATAATEAELVAAVRAADAAGEPLLLLAGGSNVLVADDGFPGTVVRVATSGVRVVSEDLCGGAVVTAAAGESWDALVALAVERGFTGIEAMSGIPGTVGATPVQNVGAYGQEVSQTIATVRVFDRVDARVRTLASADLQFGYRTSLLKRSRTALAGDHPESRYVVLDVTFQLRPGALSAPVAYPELARELGVELGGRAPLADVRAAVLALRARKGMVLEEDDRDTWSAGSFFTNPVLPVADAERLPSDAPRYPAGEGLVKTSAAWLIERAGFGKGHGTPGPAALSTKHTLALTNRGGARAADLLALAREVADGVEERFGVRIVNEPVLVGCSL